MNGAGSSRYSLTREPRGGWHAWIPIAGGLLAIAYGVFALNSAGPAGLPTIVVGFLPITCGVAELLPADRVRTAKYLRIASFAWIPLFFVALVIQA